MFQITQIYHNNDHVWSWGFLTNPSLSEHEKYVSLNAFDESLVECPISGYYDPKNYNGVDPSEWYYFESQNLMELDPRPVVITNITIAGNGWDFESMIDNVALVGKR